LSFGRAFQGKGNKVEVWVLALVLLTHFDQQYFYNLEVTADWHEPSELLTGTTAHYVSIHRLPLLTVEPVVQLQIYIHHSQPLNAFP